MADLSSGVDDAVAWCGRFGSGAADLLTGGAGAHDDQLQLGVQLAEDHRVAAEPVQVTRAQVDAVRRLPGRVQLAFGVGAAGFMSG